MSTQQVEVVEGTQNVTFTDIATGNGLRRYQVEVENLDDSVTQNNIAFAAVDVGGSPKVLMVEGTEGEGTELASALEAGGLEVDTIPVQEVPQLDELLSYSSVLLVNVAEGQLSTRQVGALGGAVRDGGRGLLTIGGTRSYGLGGLLHERTGTSSASRK